MSSMEPVILAKNVRPFYGRATLIESPVDQIETEGGVVIPLKHDDDEDVRRGVVLDVDNPWVEGTSAYKEAELLVPGTVVYYRGGVSIRDVIVVELGQIIGFESIETE